MSFLEFAPLRMAALAALVSLGLTACDHDLTAPEDPIQATGGSVAQALSLDGSTMGLDPGTRGVPTRPSGPNLSLRLVDRAGSSPTWLVLSRGGSPIAHMADLNSALSTAFADPMRGYQIAYGFDFHDQAGYVNLLDELEVYHDAIWGDPHVQDLLQQMQTDPSQLTRAERRYVRRVLLPMSETIEALDKLREAQSGRAKVWGVLKAFIEVLVGGEDNRFGDHDQDGTINAKDDDYSGTLWSGGPVTVSTSGGGDTNTSVGGCFDPCPVPAACD